MPRPFLPKDKLRNIRVSYQVSPEELKMLGVPKNVHPNKYFRDETRQRIASKKAEAAAAVTATPENAQG